MSWKSWHWQLFVHYSLPLLHLTAVVVDWLSCVQFFATPRTAIFQASLSFIVSQSLFKFMSMESVMTSSNLILCCPLLFLPAIFPSIRVKGFSIVNEAEVDIFQEFPCFLYDPMNVGNLLSGSPAFSKPNLYIWKFSVHILLKTSLKDFEHYFTSMWD